MYNHLFNYLNSNNILFENQYGFRDKHSVFMALLQLIDDISCELDQNNNSRWICIDHTKAFDTIDHSLLLKKLQHYGIRGMALDWFTSYLSNRHRYDNTNDVESSTLPIKCGVLQGSILGQLLFALYINDIVNSSQLEIFIKFADYTNLFWSTMTYKPYTVLLIMNYQKISHYFKLNKFSLNVKNERNVFNSKTKKSPSNKLAIYVDNIEWCKLIKQIILVWLEIQNSIELIILKL